MAVSEARRLEILQLSNGERVHYMDTEGFTDEDWDRLDEEVSEEISEFCRTNSDPQELHVFADTWNWRFRSCWTILPARRPLP